MPPNNLERIIRFVQSHPGFYAGHTNEHVVIAVGWVNSATGECGIDYETASTIQAARSILGY